MQRHGQFPSFRGSDFPLSSHARAYSLLSGIFLAWIPRLLDWRINAAIQNFYGELKFLETGMDGTVTDNPMALRQLLSQLDAIEKQVSQMDLPAEFSERWYTLREHLAAARDRLMKLRAR